ncbi:hypothetical protein QJS66_07880 [Kocuria rhizophila]|nr:hypothetical protein QJS66_07880 [Kocuria rhizophila]
MVLVLRCTRHMPYADRPAGGRGAVPGRRADVPHAAAPAGLGLLHVAGQHPPQPAAGAATLPGVSRAIAWLSLPPLLSARVHARAEVTCLRPLDTIPLESLYSLPATPTSPKVQRDVHHVRAPALRAFPETSFMVGTLSLMAMALVVVVRHHGRRMTPRDVVAMTLVLWAVAIPDRCRRGGAGSRADRRDRALRRAPGVGRRAAGARAPPAPSTWAWTSWDRRESFNWSWRTVGPRSSPPCVNRSRILTRVPRGVGRGRSNQLSSRAACPWRLQHYNPCGHLLRDRPRGARERDALRPGAHHLPGRPVPAIRGPQSLRLGACTLVVWFAAAGGTTKLHAPPSGCGVWPACASAWSSRATGSRRSLPGLRWQPGRPAPLTAHQTTR